MQSQATIHPAADTTHLVASMLIASHISIQAQEDPLLTDPLTEALTDLPTEAPIDTASLLSPHGIQAPEAPSIHQEASTLEVKTLRSSTLK